MSHWKTDEIKNLIFNATKSLPVNSDGLISAIDIDVNQPGGDVDTEGIIVKIDKDEDTLWISGFTLVEDTLKLDSSDMDIEAIEVTDGKDSRGGLNSENLNTSIVYAHIVSILRQNGHAVVPTMSDYF